MDTIDKIALGAVAVLFMLAVALVIVLLNDSSGPEIGTAMTCEQVSGVVVCVER